MHESEARLRALVDAGISITSELSLDALLERLTATAAALTGAQYAALGVIDRRGHELERFVTYGLSDDEEELIGTRPQGRGILGVLIRDAKPLRLDDLAHDPRSVGFPPGHPPMRTFLGVPIMLRGTAYGNLYLTEKQEGESFHEDDEDIARLLAAQAAVAIENSRLYESATRWLRQLESLNEIGNALTMELDLPRLLSLVATRFRGLVGARLVLIALPMGDTFRIEAADGEHASTLVGDVLPREGSKLGKVFDRRRSERVDSVLDDPEFDQESARRIGMRTALYVPLVVRDRVIGVMGAHDREAPDERFSDDDLRLAEAFADRAAYAVDLSEYVTRDALRRVVAAQELERTRLARELHDETGQALTSVLLGLKALESAGSEARMDAIADLRELVADTARNVRRLAVELRPAALDDFGLVPAVERLTQTFAEQSGISVDFESRIDAGRLDREVETALYRIVQEALTNIVKHADAHHVSVLLTEKRGSVTAIVEDDGRGMDRTADTGGLGLLGMQERLLLLSGRLAVESSAESGTTIVAEVPTG